MLPDYRDEPRQAHLANSLQQFTALAARTAAEQPMRSRFAPAHLSKAKTAASMATALDREAHIHDRHVPLRDREKNQ